MLFSRQRLQSFLANRGEGVAGVSAVEFAFIAPLLLLLLICTVDLGFGFYRKMQVENAAQAGAQYAALKGFDQTAIQNAVRQATSFAGIEATPSPNEFCGCPSSTGVAIVVCSSTCSGAAPGVYVQVSAQGLYETMLIYPLLPENYTFVAQATVRVH